MRSNRSNRLSNDAGILFFNTWRYYIANFGCLHFKGRGIEDNFYLLRPIFLPNGERVYNRATFQLAKEAGIVREGIDYILNDHQAAVSAAKFFYHQEEYEDSDFLFYIAYFEASVLPITDHIAVHWAKRAPIQCPARGIYYRMYHQPDICNEKIIPCIEMLKELVSVYKSPHHVSNPFCNRVFLIISSTKAAILERGMGPEFNSIAWKLFRSKHAPSSASALRRSRIISS